ncbi:MAG: HNH endonuclease [Caldilineae bacterium]|nr:HNH endonuclease [Anaerolineae bacterium]MCB0199850.1 HNH endonuclease [Anaerolineae bacterium]MCB0204060.1 HNH endonuclease [Anaerolineae bacterium]MCB0253217.1 HNH endonuclease [Anaerolineae bacterium]MCB9154832.1 HNH endonuclease [Caldilineae bacterium]
MATLPNSLRQHVFVRAEHRCEYCHTSRRVIGMPLVVDHIIPKALGGTDDPSNLCAACYRCNEYKGAKTHDLDPVSGEFVPLFHPRLNLWREHLVWTNGGTHIAGVTATGRATVLALRLNNDHIVEARVLWIARQWHPPVD